MKAFLPKPRWFNGFISIAILGGSTAVAAISAVSVSDAPSDQSASRIQFSAGISEILKMVDAKVEVNVIEAYIETSPTAYNPSASEIIMLKERGVPSEVIAAMLKHGSEIRSRTMAYANTPPQAPPNATAPYPQNPDYSYAPDTSYPDYGYPSSSAYYDNYGYGYPYYSYSYPWYGYWPSYYGGYYPYGGYYHRYPYYSYGHFGHGNHFTAFRGTTRFNGGFNNFSGHNGTFGAAGTMHAPTTMGGHAGFRSGTVGGGFRGGGFAAHSGGGHMGGGGGHMGGRGR